MADLSTRQMRDPEKAKTLRLAKDRVNAYGENDKASRKAIPRFKAETNRTHRHHAKQALSAIDGVGDLMAQADAHLADTTFKGLHPGKTKVADVPVGLSLGWAKGEKPRLALKHSVAKGDQAGYRLTAFRSLRGEKE